VVRKGIRHRQRIRNTSDGGGRPRVFEYLFLMLAFAYFSLIVVTGLLPFTIIPSAYYGLKAWKESNKLSA
jgi:hypothetical protein